MRGDLLSVWGEVWSELIVKLAERKAAPVEIFAEIYAAVIPKPTPPAPPTDMSDDAARSQYEEQLKTYLSRYEEAITVSPKTRDWLREDLANLVKTEALALSTLEKIYQTVSDIGGDDLSNAYFNIVESFLVKYSLRYDLRRPFSLHPTVPGIFSRLFFELKVLAAADADLHAAMLDFEDSVRDLRNDKSATRIKTCIAKQTNLLEAIGQRLPAVTSKTLGTICDQAGTWPHKDVKESMKSLYRFASDYPGIRHGGTASNKIREIEIRDLVSMSALLVGFTPYLTDQLDNNAVYSGGAL